MQEKMKSLSASKKLLNSAAIILAPILILLFFSLTATAGEWNVAPSNPYLGDNLVITGNATPNQELTAEVSFEKNVIASKGKYEYTIPEVKIPTGKNNLFAVRAEQVNNLNVKVKKLVEFTLSKNAIDGIATISQSKVPPLTYEVEMYGDALEEESNVKLRITASQTITADSNGNFRYEYETNTLPEGEFKITIGDISKTITLTKWHSSSSHSDNSHLVIIKPSKTQNDTPQENMLGGNISEGEFEEESGKETINIPDKETVNVSDKNDIKTQSDNPAEKRPILVISLIALGIVCILLWTYYTKKLKR